jgi:hypothetical protein
MCPAFMIPLRIYDVFVRLCNSCGHSEPFEKKDVAA